MAKTKINVKKLDEDFKDVVKRYSQAFVDMYFTFDDGSVAETWWIAQEFGGILTVNDYYFSLDDIRFCVNWGIPWDTVSEWYDYCVRVGTIDKGIPTPNIKSWSMGCPRLSEEEMSNLEERQRMVDRAAEMFKKEVDDVTSRMGFCKKTEQKP